MERLIEIGVPAGIHLVVRVQRPGRRPRHIGPEGEETLGHLFLGAGVINVAKVKEQAVALGILPDTVGANRGPVESRTPVAQDRYPERVAEPLRAWRRSQPVVFANPLPPGEETPHPAEDIMVIKFRFQTAGWRLLRTSHLCRPFREKTLQQRRRGMFDGCHDAWITLGIVQHGQRFAQRANRGRAGAANSCARQLPPDRFRHAVDPCGGRGRFQPNGGMQRGVEGMVTDQHVAHAHDLLSFSKNLADTAESSGLLVDPLLSEHVMLWIRNSLI